MFDRIKKSLIERPSRTELAYTTISEDDFKNEVHPEFGVTHTGGETVLLKGTAFAWIHWTGNGKYLLEYRRSTKDTVINLGNYSLEESRDVRGFEFGDLHFLLKVK